MLHVFHVNTTYDFPCISSSNLADIVKIQDLSHSFQPAKMQLQHPKSQTYLCKYSVCRQAV